ncbi:MAG: hypothetical protein QNL57_06775 [Alphaproteobacteria bacterium]
MAETAAPSQWHLLRDISVSYAHCFMFVSPAIREPLCTVLLLALELEKALVSEEVMIRLIRIQWWDDAISAGTSHHAHPLIRQIITLKEQGILTAETLDGLCESWRSAAEDRDCLAAAWQTSIACLASIIGASNMSGGNDEIARKIGAQISQSRTHQPVTALTQDDRHALMRSGAIKSVLSGLSFMAVRSSTENSPHPDDDPLFIFKLCWHLLRHSSA